MKKTFLKSGEVVLINGGYLATKKGNDSVRHEAFEKAQADAHYIVTMAKLAEGKNFVGVKADSLEDLKKQVELELSSKANVFLARPEKVERTVTEQLKKEALSFISFQEETSAVDKINSFLQQFNVLQEFEEHGLYFEEGIVKLKKVYTVEEIIVAVKSVIDLLN